MTRTLLRLCATVGLLAASASAGHAGTVSYSSYAVLNNQNVTLTDPALNISNELGGSGQVSLALTTGQVLQTWCVDIADDLLAAGNLASPVTMTGATWTAIDALISNGSALLGTDYNASSALQVAIWQEKYGSALAVSTSAAILNDANTFETNVANGTWKADPTTRVAVLAGNGANQDQAYLVKVPEPASVALLAAGLLALVVHRRRGQRTAATA